MAAAASALRRKGCFVKFARRPPLPTDASGTNEKIAMKPSSQGATLEANKVAGTRLELLLFRTRERGQLFGINLFKVQEIMPYRKLTPLPLANPLISGIANLRGQTMSVVDLSRAIGGPPLAQPEKGAILITEYNRSVHGFLVHSVDRIVHTGWESVDAPPPVTGRSHYLTAVTLIDRQMIGILDVERVLDQIVHAKTDLSAEVAAQAPTTRQRILVVDDSLVARKQVVRALAGIGVDCLTANDGQEAIELLNELAGNGHDMRTYFDMIISDIEMPHVDGYMLTQMIRARGDMQSTYILLHSSISGEFNWDMVNRTGANRFIQKYCPDDLAKAVIEHFAEAQAAGAA
jgi:two-component system chemotaxis response regulator CheV